MAVGVVKFFKEDKGWGAITVEELGDRDVFAHFSVIEATGYRSLTAGDVVEVDYEAAEQDSFSYTAVRVRLLSSGPAPTLRRRGDQVVIAPADTPDTPLPSRGRSAGRAEDGGT